MTAMTSDAASTVGAKPPTVPGGPGSITVERVTHTFGSGPAAVRALDDVSFTLTDGEFAAIVGASGCGKTTMLNLIAGIEPTQEGSITVSGGEPAAGHPDIAYLFARDSLLPWRTVLGNVELGMEIRGTLPSAERRERARDYLGRVGLAAHAEAYPAQLSHGMRQRVALARTIAQQPRIILLDEPFSALDAQTKILLQGVFMDLWQDIRATVVIITHDLGEAITLADRVMLFSSRPGRLKQEFAVPLPRPRNPLDLQSDPQYHELYENIWSQLRTEVTP